MNFCSEKKTIRCWKINQDAGDEKPSRTVVDGVDIILLLFYHEKVSSLVWEKLHRVELHRFFEKYANISLNGDSEQFSYLLTPTSKNEVHCMKSKFWSQWTQKSHKFVLCCAVVIRKAFRFVIPSPVQIYKSAKVRSSVSWPLTTKRKQKPDESVKQVLAWPMTSRMTLEWTYIRVLFCANPSTVIILACRDVLYGQQLSIYGSRSRIN